MKTSTIDMIMFTHDVNRLFSAEDQIWNVRAYESKKDFGNTKHLYRMIVKHPEGMDMELTFKNYLKKLSEVQAIFIGDLNMATLHIHNVPKHWSSEDIEEFVISKGHKLSECSWGAFDGNVQDERL